ncbi:MAG: guanylate kinase [Candidatus Omnitrophota bacterium]|nr:guanylate kinase [Candidatus Omnitrophota bacterium]MBU1928990.1 guanylate kinase [Candidatus Omnitrophota bacterium]MBU2035695.1 guanylate kinase [Candidatus Omnitrophota bacterium]MBU2222295.1 guanylate kinase [Candidatus Omnitrophota bacterium]MBU2258736.1 guanylate kinase [Candidatus Omnitrophota bacterium]
MQNRGIIFVVSGPSGSGKTTLVQGVLKDKGLKNRFVRSVSFTTRLKRTGEKQGRDYFFISRTEFEANLKAKKILEWTKYLGYYYGTPKEFVDKQLKRFKNLFFCIDLKGARNIKRIYPGDTVTIFIRPGSLSDLPLRIRRRCQATKAEEIKKRLSLAKKEMLAAKAFDYQLVNKNLKEALKELKEIVLAHTSG